LIIFPAVEIGIKAVSAHFDRGTLLTVPGFHAHGAQLRFWGLPGLLIPVRDVAGQIVALSIRPDEKLDDGGKYLWVSSKSKGGSSPGAPCHVPTSKRSDDGLVRVTEGALKADVASALSGMLTIGAAGVANWGPTLPVLKELGAKTVRVAFDCDATTKPAVAMATIACCEGLAAAGFNIEVERWPWKDGKGIDDVLLRGKPVEVLTGEALDTFLHVLRDGITLPTNWSGAALTAGGNGRHIGNGKAPAAVATPVVFRNFHWAEKEVKGDDGEVKAENVREPLRSSEIAAELNAAAGDWPKRIGEDLFVQTADFRPVSLSSAARLFAWIDHAAPVDWTKGSRFITQERFYEWLSMSVEQFDSIETLPHFLPLPRTYYMHPALPKPTGALDRLLDFFAPLTAVDRELIKAFIMTPLWGGQPGSRPAFLVTGPDRDEHQGRGIGKTTLIQIMADEIFGGAFKARQSKDFDDMVTRLLSREARQKRIALLDNVKTFNFSWGDMEDLITSSVISGRQLYVGDGTRPNYLVWAITLNGASLSKDMAQRVIPIKLARPTFKAEWESSIRTFAREHRAEILADVGDHLRHACVSITPATRWAAWEADVLAATIDPAATQQVIVERQGDVDAGNSDRDIVQDYFARKIRAAGHNPDTTAVRFNAQTATQWSNEAMNRKEDATRVGGFLRGLNIPELTPKSSHGVRSWTWRGTSADRDLAPFDID
jgi:hypothetical protein